MSALSKSFRDEYEKMKKRKSAWIETPTGWFHTYDKEIIDMKLKWLYNASTVEYKK